MTRRLRLTQVVALVTVAVIAAFLAGRLLLTPVEGNLLLLLTAKQPDRIAITSFDLHSSQGWTNVGTVSARAVPKAPDTSEAVLTKVPVGYYDRVRLAGLAVPIAFTVQKDILNPLLVGISDGRPMPDGTYGGNEAVSLGLNELSGQLKAMPQFSLVDQFDRPFNNTSIAGRLVVLAAFHTTCHETCPLYTGLFLQLRRQLPPAVMLVEATTDPVHDTPAVLREFAGQHGASWLFVTGAPAAMAAFWKPFDVELNSTDVHRSELAVIDAHGYLRSFYLGAPDVGNQFPPDLLTMLDSAGLAELARHGDGWGAAQVIDTLEAIGGSGGATGGQGSAHDFTLPTLEGGSVTLSSQRGRPVLINFWASWCVPCRTEMPMIERVTKTHSGLKVLLVNERDDPGAARAFVQQLGIHDPVLLDPDGKVGDVYGVSGLPTTFFIRPDGTLEGGYIGQMDETILRTHLSSIAS